MPELQAAIRLRQTASTPLQVAVRATQTLLQPLQTTGNVVYTPPTIVGGTPVGSGNLAPVVDIPERLVHEHTHELLAFDLRAYQATLAALPAGAPVPAPVPLPVSSGSLALQRGSALWELRAQGSASLAATLTAGEQPPLLGLRINGQEWRFVVEGVDHPQAFASSTVSITGRSLAALADAPYQPPQTYITDAPTTAAQIATLANTFTGLALVWQVPDWLIPEGAWSYQGSPLGVVGQVAAAVEAVVEADRAEMAVSVRPQYPVLPAAWATTAPDWQVHYSALERSTAQRADKPEYNAVLVAGQQQGSALVARYAGTSGAVQAPLVTDPLLTDEPALLERATAILAGSGRQDEVTRVLQVGPEGVVPRGSLVRWVDPDETWVGMVRSVQVDFAHGRARQTLGVERRTGFVEGVGAQPQLPACNPALYLNPIRTWYGINTSTLGSIEGAPSVARDDFRADTASTYLVDFETLPLDAPLWLGRMVPAAGAAWQSVTVYGDATAKLPAGNGRFNTTPGGEKYLEGGSAVQFVFSPPIPGAGAFFSDVGDFSGILRITVYDVYGAADTFNINLAGIADGRIFFWGWRHIVRRFVGMRIEMLPAVGAGPGAPFDFWGMDDLLISGPVDLDCEPDIPADLPLPPALLPPPAPMTLSGPTPGAAALEQAAGGMIGNPYPLPRDFALSVTPAAELLPTSGTVPPGGSLPYFFTAPADGAYTISLANLSGNGGVSGSPVVYTVGAPPVPTCRPPLAAGTYTVFQATTQNAGGVVAGAALAKRNEFVSYFEGIRTQTLEGFANLQVPPPTGLNIGPAGAPPQSFDGYNNFQIYEGSGYPGTFNTTPGGAKRAQLFGNTIFQANPAIAAFGLYVSVRDVGGGTGDSIFLSVYASLDDYYFEEEPLLETRVYTFTNSGRDDLAFCGFISTGAPAPVIILSMFGAATAAFDDIIFPGALLPECPP